VKSVLFLLLFISFSIVSFSQDDGFIPEDQPLKKEKSLNRFFWGGNLGFGASSDVVQIDLSPLIGYNITEKFAAGMGVTYQYYKDSRFINVKIETNIYGGRCFLRYFVWNDIFIHAEYELLSLESKYFNPNYTNANNDRFFVNSIFLGGGYRMMIGESASINLLLLWNINESSTSPYTNPVLRIGFNF